MKPARIFFWSASVLVVLLVWWKWPRSSSPDSNHPAPTSPTPEKAAVEPPKATPVQPTAVSAPATLPTAVNLMNPTVMDASRQETLDGLLKFQTMLQQSLDTTTDPQDREALEHELSQLQVQIQYDVGQAGTGMTTVVTNLGNITLNEQQPVQKRLASGDQATLDVATVADGNWVVNVSVQHTDANGASAIESASVVVQPSQPAVIKTTGNEIHFTPQPEAKASAN